jgi:hypothetical protein
MYQQFGFVKTGFEGKKVLDPSQMFFIATYKWNCSSTSTLGLFKTKLISILAACGVQVGASVFLLP